MSETPPHEPAATPEPEPEPTTAREPGPPRRLLRSRRDRVLGGVCGGLARYFNVDPLIVRIAAVALIFVGGFAVMAYVAALLLVPVDDGTGRPSPGRPGRLSTILGAIIVVFAGIALLDGHWGVGAGWLFGGLAPTLVVATALAIAGQRLLAGRGETQPTAARIAGAALVVGGVLLGALVVAVGGGLATAAGGGTGVAIAVVVLGALMVVLSFRDRRARWLAVPALALAIPSGVVAAADVDVHHGIGERTYAPPTIADLRPGGYELGVGQLEIDLRDTDWPASSTARLRLDVGIGHALVLVPDDVCVQADTHAGLGYVNLLGNDDGGADLDDQRGTVSRAPMRRLIVDAKVGMGAVEVRHRVDGRRWGRHRVDQISAALADAGCAGERA